MSEIPGKVGRYVVRCFTIDTRTLAVFRMLVGLLIIGDLVVRAQTFNFFYTDNGVVPTELARERTFDNAFSFFFFTEDPTITAILFIIHGLVAVQLILGYKTTLAMVVSFLFIVSLDHHNPLVLSHADTLFRLITFWAIFIPLGERWSIDAIQAGREPRPSVANLGTAAILLQMVYMYTVNGIHKLGSEMWNSREATPLIFGLDDMTFFLAEPMRRFPTMLEYGGTLWYFMLVTSALLIFLPGRPRTAFTWMFIIVHASFAITVRIGGFAPVAIAGVMLFLPTQFWNDLQTLARRLRIWDPHVLRVQSAVERFGVRVATLLPTLRPNIGVPVVVRDGVYDVAMTAAIMAIFIFPSIMFLADIDIIEWEQSAVEQRIDETTRIFGVRQSQWTVFAPTPRTTDRYYVFPALTTDGELIDVYNDRPFTFARPGKQLQLQYGTYRERFYLNSIRRAAQGTPTVEHYAQHFCNKWRDERGIELTHINMYVIHERVTMDTIDDPDGRERWSDLMSLHGCFGNEPAEIELPEDPPSL